MCRLMLLFNVMGPVNIRLWHDELSSAFLAQGFDSLAESFGAKGRTITYGSEILQVYLVGRELRTCHLLHLERKVLIERVILVGFGCCMLIASKQVQTKLKSFFMNKWGF